jgi:hypothetical protein
MNSRLKLRTQLMTQNSKLKTHNFSAPPDHRRMRRSRARAAESHDESILRQDHRPPDRAHLRRQSQRPRRHVDGMDGTRPASNSHKRETKGSPSPSPDMCKAHSSERAPRASHAPGPPTPFGLRRGLAVALRAKAEASRRSGEGGACRGVRRGEAPRMRDEIN